MFYYNNIILILLNKLSFIINKGVTFV